MKEPFDILASLLLPEEGGVGVQADADWSVRDLPSDARAVVWGREPWSPGTPGPVLARSALARERALRRTRRRPPAGVRVHAVHRWPPPGARPGAVADRLRRALLGGAVVELAPERFPRVVDLCARAAGVVEPVEDIRPVSAGAVIARVGAAEGPAVLRATWKDGPGDPLRAAAALDRLRGLKFPFLPRSLGRGGAGEAVWMVETELPGKKAWRVDGPLAAQLLRFVAALPRAEGSPAGPTEDLEAIAQAFPRWAPTLDRIAEQLRGHLEAMPAVICHGDLWAGNLLVQRRRLTGVVDWDAWRPAGVPGTDLLHLFGTDLASRSGRPLGAIWLTRPWRSTTFTAWAAPYWRQLNIQPQEDLLDVVGVCWWAGRVAYRLGVRPGLADDRRWVAGTVDAVLATLGN